MWAVVGVVVVKYLVAAGHLGGGAHNPISF
jgi:hypothetical protein